MDRPRGVFWGCKVANMLRAIPPSVQPAAPRRAWTRRFPFLFLLTLLPSSRAFFRPSLSVTTKFSGMSSITTRNGGGVEVPGTGWCRERIQERRFNGLAVWVSEGP